MKFALVNPAWEFSGSIYFGCQEAHYPLELLFGFDKIREAGHEPFLIDAQLEKLGIGEVKRRLDSFQPDFLVMPTAPSYLFWRCPPPELRIPKQWFSGLESRGVKVAVGPHASATPGPTLRKLVAMWFSEASPTRFCRYSLPNHGRRLMAVVGKTKTGSISVRRSL